ncbi:sensor histidine kinase [Paenibacillus contaminans]|uniref:HAMP domain-containing protein n=1 Tax=Paenibacillus contaminans TaxID=450362 RepID=A0A329MT04_9BACL|nr:histidine kinase [Paenibacillus contaminans]RAV22486.1 hypothetical protein DQG23_05990 [Paenibacillus contaminans]
MGTKIFRSIRGKLTLILLLFIFLPWMLLGILLLFTDYTGNPLGVFLANGSVPEARAIMNQADANPDMKAYLVDREGNIVYGAEQRYSLTKKMGSILDFLEGAKNDAGADNDELVVSIPLKDYGWKLVSVIPVRTVLNELSFIKKVAIGILACGLVCCILFYFIVKRMMNPIFLLRRKMKRFESGDMNVAVNIGTKDEFSELGDSFNHMVGQIKQLIDREYASKIRWKEAEYRALQSQINPHFIANTLESISMHALMKDDMDTARMINQLGLFFKKMVYTQAEWIRIDDEMAMIRDYFRLYEIRFRNRFHLDIQVDESLLDRKIPSFILQPLVENALFHGMEKKEGPGRLHISLTLVLGERLYIVVEDDGVGIPEQRLRQLTNDIKQTDGQTPLHEENQTHSIALKNIYRRLLLLFAERLEYRIESSVGAGTAITLGFPLPTETGKGDSYVHRDDRR